tara:strand:- start:105 stop:386 length:282 start_codon:yes stop_codon:yes gene_type:complete
LSGIFLSYSLLTGTYDGSLENGFFTFDEVTLAKLLKNLPLSWSSLTVDFLSNIAAKDLTFPGSALSSTFASATAYFLIGFGSSFLAPPNTDGV